MSPGKTPGRHQNRFQTDRAAELVARVLHRPNVPLLCRHTFLSSSIVIRSFQPHTLSSRSLMTRCYLILFLILLTTPMVVSAQDELTDKPSLEYRNSILKASLKGALSQDAAARLRSALPGPERSVDPGMILRPDPSIRTPTPTIKPDPKLDLSMVIDPVTIRPRTTQLVPRR